MAMNAGDIEKLIKEALPDARVEIRDLAGDGDHYAAKVVSEPFRRQVPRPAAPAWSTTRSRARWAANCTPWPCRPARRTDGGASRCRTQLRRRERSDACPLVRRRRGPGAFALPSRRGQAPVLGRAPAHRHGRPARTPAGPLRPDFMDVMTGKTSLVAALDAFLPTIGYRGSTMSFIAYWMERDTHINYALIDAIQRLRRARRQRVSRHQSGAHPRRLPVARVPARAHLRRHVLCRPPRRHQAGPGVLPGRSNSGSASRRRSRSSSTTAVRSSKAPKLTAGKASTSQRIEDFTGHPWVAGQLG